MEGDNLQQAKLILDERIEVEQELLVQVSWCSQQVSLGIPWVTSVTVERTHSRRAAVCDWEIDSFPSSMKEESPLGRKQSSIVMALWPSPSLPWQRDSGSRKGGSRALSPVKSRLWFLLVHYKSTNRFILRHTGSLS